MVCCAETKCKVEETEITLDTIERSLNKARAQMPSDMPGIIFVKVPRFWLDGEDFTFAMARLATEYFQKASKVVSIKYYTTLMSAFPSSRRVNSWLPRKQPVQALPSKAGGTAVMTTLIIL